MTTLPRRASVIVLGLLLAAGAACDRESASRSAIREAGDRLQSLSAEGIRITASDSDRRKVFEQVLQKVKPFRDGDGTETAPANLIAARATAAMADMDAATAADGERRALERGVAVRASLNLYTGQNAIAASSAFDPATLLKDLDDQLRMLDETAAKRATDKAAASRQREDLLARAKVAVDKSKGLREQAGALRRQAADTTAVRGLELTQQAVALSRQADELDRQAGYLQADADALSPVIAAFDREAESIATQKTLTQARRAEIVKRAEAARGTVADSTATAATAAAAISRQVGELAAHRSGDMDAAASRAANGYRDALAAAKKALAGAKGSDRTGTQVVVGAIQQSWGHLSAIQWRGRQAYAALLTLLADAKPAMEGAEKYRADAAAAQTAADEALAAAKQQYQDAIDTYGGVQGATDEVKARIERIKQILTDLNAGKYDGAPAAAPVAPAPAPVTPAPAVGDRAATAPAGDQQAAIRAVLDKYHEAMRNRDMAGVLALTKTDSDQARAMLESMGAFGKSALELDAACQAKFGKSLQDILAAGPMGQSAGGLGQLAKGMQDEAGRTSADYTIEMSGQTKAVATLKNPGPTDSPHSMIFDGGKWWLHMPDDKMAGAGMIAPILKPLGDVFASLATDVNSGKIGTEQLLNAALLQRLTPIMQRLQNPSGLPQPGGG